MKITQGFMKKGIGVLVLVGIVWYRAGEWTLAASSRERRTCAR